MSRGILLGRDPSGLAPAPAAAGILDTRPHRNRYQPRLKKGTALTDDVLIATLVNLGCPRFFAEELRLSEQLRFQAASVYFVVERAARGGAFTHPVTGYPIPAKNLMDSMVFEYQEMRKVELISDRPEHTIGLFER